MSHKKVTIASILKIWLGLDSKILKLDHYMKNGHFGLLLTGCQVLLWNKPTKSRWNRLYNAILRPVYKISIDFGPENMWQYCRKPRLKVNWNAETSWSLSQDFEALKTVSKEFLRNSFSFSRLGRWNLRFYWFGRFPRKDGVMCVRYRESHAKELWRQRRSLSSLQVRFINDSELCSVPVARWNSSNLTWIWLHWTRTVPKNISWMKNRHTCYECWAKWCVRANQRHHGDDDPANDYN